jgi:hypothetical protein
MIYDLNRIATEGSAQDLVYTNGQKILQSFQRSICAEQITFDSLGLTVKDLCIVQLGQRFIQ